jgi:hypothetical protein
MDAPEMWFNANQGAVKYFMVAAGFQIATLPPGINP